MKSLIEVEKENRIKHNLKVLKKAERDDYKKLEFDSSRLGNPKGKKLNYKVNSKGIYGVGKL